ncbi:unnamed protein product, partial [Closterium sp. NIES-53]
MARNSAFVPLYFVCGVLVVVMLLASAAASSAYRVADGQRQRIGQVFSAMPRLPPTSRRSRQAAASVTPSQARIKLQPSQLEALLALDQAWALWDNSASNVFCYEWGGGGVECNQDGMVTDLSTFFSFHSYGDVPADITVLSALQKLDLSFNRFSGSLEILGHFPELQYVDLSNTHFRGSIPETISNAQSLQYLNLEGLYLSGSLPGSISRLTALQSLRIGIESDDRLPYRYLNGHPNPIDPLSIEPYLPFPVMQGSMDDLSCLAPLTRLQNLALMSLNLAAGDLPSSLSMLTSLKHLDLSFLPITRFPQWIASLSKLTYLDITGKLHVHHSAPFPTEWIALTRLETLRAGLNGFTGSIPSTISALTALTTLDLYGNNISGSIPTGISELPRLNALDLSHNQLTSMPSTINWGHVSMAHNQLQGPLPSTLLSTDFVTLELQGNAFSGPLPNFALWKYPYLEIFDVRDNQLSGSLPDSISRLASLWKLGLGGNNLSGVIPASLGGLTDLTLLNVSGTELTCPADGSKCLVKQSNTTVFCLLCFSFCSSCTPLA